MAGGWAFGNTSVQTVSDDQGVVSAYGALRSANSLTLVLINKTTSDLTTPVLIEGQTGMTGAFLLQLQQRGPDRDPQADECRVHVPARAAVTLPAYSMNMLVILLN